MRVLITADTVGGVWTYTRELVAGLTRHGVQVTLVSFGELPTPRQSLWMDGLRGLDYRPTAYRLEWMQDAEGDVERSTRYLKTVIREIRPDLLHFNQYCYGNLDVDVPRLVVAHSDVVSWWIAVHGEEPPPSPWLRWYRQVASRGLRAATAVVAPSRWMLNVLSEIYGPPSKSMVVYNGRSPRLFNPHMTKTECVLSVGRLWDCAKQVSLLTRYPQAVPVWIAGSEVHPEEGLRGESGVAAGANVELKGPLPEKQMRMLYTQAAMYAATSRYEPFGLAPLEAALSRCALLANDIPSFHELWGDTAVYFRRNDGADLAEKIRQLASDPALRRAYALRAYRRALQLFTAERMVNEYLQLYCSLVREEALAA
ncbi:MAG TPA: glycosyltransferase family 4 protein [Terriglobales bacterium]|nr:glycosyltransferase family 4 protein [Terriglobales bacterium]